MTIVERSYRKKSSRKSHSRRRKSHCKHGARKANGKCPQKRKTSRRRRSSRSRRAPTAFARYVKEHFHSEWKKTRKASRKGSHGRVTGSTIMKRLANKWRVTHPKRSRSKRSCKYGRRSDGKCRKNPSRHRKRRSSVSRKRRSSVGSMALFMTAQKNAQKVASNRRRRHRSTSYKVAPKVASRRHHKSTSYKVAPKVASRGRRHRRHHMSTSYKAAPKVASRGRRHRRHRKSTSYKTASKHRKRSTAYATKTADKSDLTAKTGMPAKTSIAEFLKFY